MRITTWNINSVRLRAPLATQVLKILKPDVLCLQETKCPNELFPYEVFQEVGYPHICVNGMKGYNGVALISRIPFEKTNILNWVGREDCRHISAVFEDGIELHNFYIPAGGDEPNIEKNEKFDHKLKFITEMTDWFSTNRKPTDPMVLVGDLNIAPLECDVWSHKQLLKVVSHTPIEVDHLNRLMSASDWIDTARYLTPEPKKLFTWWSYRSREWRTANKGRRLDHIWVTPLLKQKIVDSGVLRDARGWEKPSDHAPVTTDLGQF